ncbi:MAG: MltA domain-containing protein [Syntrophobacterales bacterium]|nr:MltA domain-containing protein [Syntrophobacterales bacterium]
MTRLRFCLVFLLLWPALLSIACRPVAELPREESWRPYAPDPAGRDESSFLDDLDYHSLEQAVTRSIAFYEQQGARGSYCYRDRCRTAAEMIADLREFLRIAGSDRPAPEREKAVREKFLFLPAAEEVLVTGYYEPILNGALHKSERFRYPIYRPPPEAVVVRLDRFAPKYGNDRLIGQVRKGEVLPLPTRREIDGEGALQGRGLEIAWVDDPVALFSLHVQGSGKIRLPDGRMIRVTYAQSNGRPFRGLTAMMADRGLLKEGERSYELMKKTLYERAPEERQELMNFNERYIFFRVVPEGPLGALGLPLVAGRSIAADLDLYPRGGLAMLKTRKPVFDREGNIVSWQSFTRFVLNQDAGAAIKGPGRIDLFCGTGPEAERTAGAMKEKGELYFLFRK